MGGATHPSPPCHTTSTFSIRSFSKGIDFHLCSVNFKKQFIKQLDLLSSLQKSTKDIFLFVSFTSQRGQSSHVSALSHGHAGTQVCRHAGIQACRHAGTQACRHTGTHPLTHSHTQVPVYMQVYPCTHAPKHAIKHLHVTTLTHPLTRLCTSWLLPSTFNLKSDYS